MSPYIIPSILTLLTLGGCQSTPGAFPSTSAATTEYMGSQPASDAEMAQAISAGERAQAIAPAVAAASVAGGLDPTGIAQTAISSEAERRMLDLQRHLPGMAARNRQDTERLCASRPAQPELADACRQFALAKTNLEP